MSPNGSSSGTGSHASEPTEPSSGSSPHYRKAPTSAPLKSASCASSTASTRHSRRSSPPSSIWLAALAAVSAAALLAPASANAQAIGARASVGARIAYDDNYLLAPDVKQENTTTTVQADLTVNRRGPRTTLGFEAGAEHNMHEGDA